jgi:hypothetical protein
MVAAMLVVAASTRTHVESGSVLSLLLRSFSMTKSDIAAMIAKSVSDAVGALKFQQAAAPAPTVAVAAPADDIKAKRLAALEKARAAKKANAKAKAEKPATVIVEAPKPVKEKKARPAWEVKPHTTKKGDKGTIVSVGPFSAWIPEGDAARKQAVFAAINLLRTDAAHEIAKQIG